MRHPLCGTLAAIVGLWFGAVSAAGQTPTATPHTHSAGTDTWTPARTLDGQPDIQGIWEGGAGFSERGVESPQVNVGPAEEVGRDANGAPDCRSLRSVVGTVCAAYPALWTHAQGLGLIGGEPDPSRAPRRRGFVDLPDGKLPWTATGAAKKRAILEHYYEPPTLEYVDPLARCMLPGIRMGAGPYQILQIPGYVVLLIEQNHATRIIPVDGRPHVNPDIRLFMGDSVGRWEGQTLVVDTTNYTGTAWYDMIGTPQSNALHTIERFTIVDANTIDYTVTINDSTLFSRPWTYAGSFTRGKGEGVQMAELLEHACAEGSSALENTMERPERPLPPAKLLPR